LPVDIPMAKLIPTLLVVLLNIHFFVHSTEIILNGGTPLTNDNRTRTNGREVFASPSNKYIRTGLPETPALKGSPRISHPSILLQSISANLFMQAVAGTNTSGYSGDNGPATSARIQCYIPWVDTGGNIYIGDSYNHIIRKVTPAGIITTFGGTGIQGFAGTAGPIESASFDLPYSIVGDVVGTVLYICDHRYIWKYEFSTNIATVFAHSGVNGGSGFSGDGGPASSSKLFSPRGIWLASSGDLFIADCYNHRIRKIISGIITTIAGSGCFNDCSNVFSGDHGLATLATLNRPYGVYVDTSGKIIIADTYNHRIRLIDTNNIITTFTGTGTAGYNSDNIVATSANINLPHDVKGDSVGNIYIADAGNNIVRLVDTNGIISTIFGTGFPGFSSGISPRISLINAPVGISIDSLSSIYFSDYNSIHGSVVVSSPTSQPSTQPSHQPDMQPTSKPSSQPSSSISPDLYMKHLAGVASSGYGGDNAPATLASVDSILIWVDSVGNIYSPDGVNYRIRTVDTSGYIRAFGGTGHSSYSGITGPINSTSFYVPWSIVGDKSRRFLYLSDVQYVWRYEFSTNIVSVMAGLSSPGYSGDGGPASLSKIQSPTGLWLTTANELYFVDNGNHCIRKISSSGIISTVVGGTNGGSSSGDEGQALSAGLNGPRGVYMDSSGKLFVAEFSGNRLVDTNNIITTFAGNGNRPYNGDYISTSAAIAGPQDVKGDTEGNIFIADYYNCVVRVVFPNRIIATAFGVPLSCGFSGGTTIRGSAILVLLACGLTVHRIFISVMGIQFIEVLVLHRLHSQLDSPVHNQDVNHSHNLHDNQPSNPHVNRVHSKVCNQHANPLLFSLELLRKV
jgi:hypothetical protein